MANASPNIYDMYWLPGYSRRSAAPVQAPAVPVAPSMPAPVAVPNPAPAIIPDQELSPGIPVVPTSPVYGQDLPALPPDVGQPAARRQFGFSAGAPSWTPLAGPPVGNRYMKPEFIYTNPAAAQQAAAGFAARMAAETQQNNGYYDYLSRLNSERNANQRSAQQVAFNRETLDAQRSEGAANRESAERISRNSELVRQQRQAEIDYQQNERLWRIGQGYADQLNVSPNDPNNQNILKGDARKYVTWDSRQGKWVSTFPPPTRPAPLNLAPTVPGVPGPAVAVPPVAHTTVDQAGRPTLVTPAWPQSQPLPYTMPEPDYMSTDFAPRRRIVVPSPPPAPMIEYPNDPGPAPMIDY